VHAERLSVGGGFRIVPRAGRQMDHAFHHLIRKDRGRETGAAIVEQANEIAVRDAAPPRIGRIELDHLAAVPHTRLRHG